MLWLTLHCSLYACMQTMNYVCLHRACSPTSRFSYIFFFFLFLMCSIFAGIASICSDYAHLHEVGPQFDCLYYVCLQHICLYLIRLHYIFPALSSLIIWSSTMFACFMAAYLMLANFIFPPIKFVYASHLLALCLLRIVFDCIMLGCIAFARSVSASILFACIMLARINVCLQYAR